MLWNIVLAINMLIAVLGVAVAVCCAFYGRWEIAIFSLVAATNCEIGYRFSRLVDVLAKTEDDAAPEASCSAVSEHVNVAAQHAYAAPSGRRYVIVCTRHKSDVGKGCLLFWGKRTANGEERSFAYYSNCLDRCERYAREDIENVGGFPFYDPAVEWREWMKGEDFAITIEQLRGLDFQFLHVCWR